MAQVPEWLRLDGDAVTLVFAIVRGGAADCVYLGPKLADGEDLAALAVASARGRHESQPDTPPVPGILPEQKGGWSGAPAIEVREGGARVETDFRVSDWDAGERVVRITFGDARLDIEVVITWRLEAGDVCVSECSATNLSDKDYELAHLSAVALPLPRRFTRLTHFSGRWAGEMRESTRPIAPDGFYRGSNGGKQGFTGGNWLLLDAPETGETIAAHLAWSGDYETRIDCDTQGAGDGRAVLQMKARRDAGFGFLPAHSSTQTPAAVFAIGRDCDAVSQSLHTYVRQSVLPRRAEWGARKVHLNSWEALGFKLSHEKLTGLADRAAALGVERFVLDDGWFGGRRDDRTSLGDWTVSPDVFPDGLNPLIDHVHALGMDFGLWVEPEMVSPDSDLYRAHPDWCIHINVLEHPTMRGQLVLDLQKPEVSEHLYAQLDLLLNHHEIAYLKWDHNRDLFPSKGGQTTALYALLDRLREAHPEVEIESCSSGGGRIDYGILSRTHRVWPSDNNDPVERARIMQAWSRFLPLEVLGNHVGPSPNPITGRRTQIDFRAKVALFGHMGVEADPAAMDDGEREVLRAHIALYKQWREVLHSGDWFALDHPDPGIFAQMVAGDARALCIAAQTGFSPEFDAAPVRLKGLDPKTQYKVTLPRPWPVRASLYLPNKRSWHDGVVLSGQALMTQGLALPLTHPETAWLIALEKLPS